MDYKKYIADRIKIEGVTAEEIASYLTVPPANDMGDFALPCFKFAKILSKRFSSFVIKFAKRKRE